MKRTAACSMWVLLALTGAAQEPRNELQKAVQEATAARQGHDYKTFLERSLRIVELAPGSTRALYGLACAYALNGVAERAVETLDRLATMEVAFDIETEADFAAIKDGVAFQAVARKMSALWTPVGSGEVAFRLPEKDAIEGVAHDPKSGDFFVSSVRRRRIVRVSPGGVAHAFTGDGQDGLLSVVALAVDPSRRALWATSDATPWRKDPRPEEEGRSWLLEYDLDSGALRRRLGPPASLAVARLSDLALGPRGEVAVADPLNGRVYLLASGEKELRTLVAPGPIASPQGMAFSPDGRWLFVADYVRGVARVDPQSGAVTALARPEIAVLGGIDGLAHFGDSLVGIQNGVRPHRIVRLRLDAEATRIVAVTVVERANPRWDEPTLGVVVGRDFYYVGTSQYGKFGDADIDDAKLEPPLVFRTRLDW